MSYGTDTWCLDKLVTGRLARGANVVAQACVRRLTTAHGTLFDAEGNALNYGIDLEALVGNVSPSEARAQLPGRIRAELLKDDRVADADVETSLRTRSDGIEEIVFAIRVSLYNEGESFTLTLAVSAVTLEILGIG